MCGALAISICLTFFMTAAGRSQALAIVFALGLTESDPLEANQKGHALNLPHKGQECSALLVPASPGAIRESAVR
jgi:hypothetical protein